MYSFRDDVSSSERSKVEIELQQVDAAVEVTPSHADCDVCSQPIVASVGRDHVSFVTSDCRLQDVRFRCTNLKGLVKDKSSQHSVVKGAECLL